MTFEIARYRPELRPGVVALLHHLVSRNDALNDAYFAWKHEANPYTDEPLAYVALAGDTVVGLRAFQGARWQLGSDGATVFWPSACDFVVAPEHRGNKLFRRIMEFATADLAERGIGRILNWSASPVTQGVSLRTGWRLIGTYDGCGRQSPRARKVERWAERIGQLPLAWRFAHVPAALLLKRGFGALDTWCASHAHRSAFAWETQPRPDTMAAIVRQTKSPRIGHLRDATYYGWRFGNPVSAYRFVFFPEHEPGGFLVLRVARAGDAAQVSVVDWAATGPDVLEAMLTHVLECDVLDGLSLWSAALDAPMTSRLGTWGLAPEAPSPRFPDYRRGLLAFGLEGATGGDDDALAGECLAGLDRWDLRPVYSDFY